MEDDYDWRLSDYVIDSKNEKNLIIKIAVEPIDRNTYYFYIYEKNNSFYVDCSYKTDEENNKYIFEAMRGLNPDKNEKFWSVYEKAICTEYFNELFRNNCEIYNMKLDEKYLSFCINEIRQLDFNTPIKREYGLDGYSLYFKLVKESKNYNSWCCSDDLYYYRIIELVNYLLKCVSVHRSRDCFEITPNKDQKYTDYKVIDNNILLDKERLLKQFKNKFDGKDEYKDTFKKYYDIVSHMSPIKIYKVNYNLRKSMLDNTRMTQRIIEYISNQAEDEIDIYDWCGYEQKYINKYKNGRED